MSKYGKAVGKMVFEIEGFDHEMSPKVGDGRKFIKLITKNENNKDKLFDDFFIFIRELIRREVPPQGEQEEQELELFIDMNLLTLFNEVMINFGMTTRAEIEAAKKESLQAINKKGL